MGIGDGMENVANVKGVKLSDRPFDNVQEMTGV